MNSDLFISHRLVNLCQQLNTSITSFRHSGHEKEGFNHQSTHSPVTILELNRQSKQS